MGRKKKVASAERKSKSMIYSALDTFAAFIYRKAENGVIGSALTAYDRENAAFHRGILAKSADKINISKKVKHAAARGCEQSAILTFFDRFFICWPGFGCGFTVCF